MLAKLGFIFAELISKLLMEREIPVSKSGEWVAAVSRVEVATSRDRVFSAGK